MPDRLKILVIDSDAKSRKALDAILQTLGCVVELTSSGSQGIKTFESAHPSIVLVCTDLEDLSGIEVLRRLTGQDPDLLVAAYSTSTDQQVAVEALKAGASDFLVKPLQDAEVRKTLSNFIALINRRERRFIKPEMLNRARLELIVASDKGAITPAVRLLTELVEGFLNTRQELRLELALDEVVRNAFEHGNLGISYLEKSTACQEGTFEQLVAQRSVVAQNDGKLIYLLAELSPLPNQTSSKRVTEFRCVVRDEGVGFDWRAFKQAPQEQHDPAKLHGRGLLLVHKIFDTVEYNDKGNEVTLVKAIYY